MFWVLQKKNNDLRKKNKILGGDIIMKWENKGHELDEFADKLLHGYSNNIYVFGAGIFGRELYFLLKKYGCFGGFIDNSKVKQKEGYLGERVISLDEYLENIHGCWIVVAASQVNMNLISKQLREREMILSRDYFLHDDFKNRIFPVISTYYYGKSFVPLAQISLTERCTLKCKKCAHACFAVDSNVDDMPIEMVYKSADSLFEKIDCIHEFVLIGGEPLLYKKLTKAISYIGEKYRNKIVIYSITTNGTIMPSEEIIELCRKYNVLFRISNYSMQIPRLKQFYNRLIDMLKKNNVAYILGKEDHEWMDYGFGSVDRKAEEQVLINVFDACQTPCHEIRGNKFYYCVMARSVSDNLHYAVGEEDYLDLNDLKERDDKKVLLEFLMGYSEKGYLDMCNYCNGAEAIKYPIPVAEQIK